MKTKMMLHVDHTYLHMIEMVHGTLVELSIRSSLGIHVYAYQETFFSDIMA